MENVLSILFSTENIRMLVMLAFGFSGFVWFKASFDKKIDDLKHNEFASINRRIDSVEFSLNKRIDGVEISIRNELVAINKRIDGVEASIGGAIEALTYALEKNGSLAREDKEYVDRRLTN
jgi:hypothetical protein